MGIYIAFFVICLLCKILFLHKHENPKRKAFVIVTGALLVFISAMRSYWVGVDTIQFYTVFERIARCSSLVECMQSTRYEPGFVLFCYILAKICNAPQILLVVSSFLIFIPILIFIYRNTKSVFISVFSFVALNYYGNYMNVMRQAIAIAIILIAIEIGIKKKRYVLYYILCVIAISFHTSAVVMLVAPILGMIKINVKTLLSVSGGSFLVFLFLNRLVNWVAPMLGYSSYISSGKYMGSNYFGAFFQFAIAAMIFILFMYVFRKGERYNAINENVVVEENRLKTNFVGWMIYLSAFFAAMKMQIEMIGRFQNVVSIFSVIAVGLILDNISERNRRGMEIILEVVFFLHWLVIAELRPEWEGVIPYSFFWSV